MARLKDFKFTLSFLLSIILAIVLFVLGAFDSAAQTLGNFGYIGAFFAGILFASTFTSASAALFFITLGEHLNPYWVGIIGGLGTMIGDLVMYHFIREKLFVELKALSEYFITENRRQKMEEFTKHRVFVWLVPFIASVLIASPLPDEIGIALFSMVNFHPKYVSIIAFLLNAIGIFSLVMIGYCIVH